MIYTLFTGKNDYNQTVEKDCDSIFTTIMTIWKPGIITTTYSGNSTSYWPVGNCAKIS
jgi:hypothetical protein